MYAMSDTPHDSALVCLSPPPFGLPPLKTITDDLCSRPMQSALCSTAAPPSKGKIHPGRISRTPSPSPLAPRLQRDGFCLTTAPG